MSDRTQLELADLIDLELQFLEDEDRPVSELHRRDRRVGLDIGRTVGGSQGLAALPRRELFLRWLAALRSDGELSAGQRVARALRRMTLALVALGFLTGWASAASLLIYDGKSPVSITVFLEIFVLLQLLLLMALGLGLCSRFATRWLPGVGTVQRWLRGALYRSGRGFDWLLGRLPEDRAAGLRRQLERLEGFESFFADNPARLGRLEALRRVYGRAERWSLVGLTQCFAIAFNVGAIIAFLHRVLFTNLAFGWQTTLFTGAEHFHGVLSALALPWRFLYPEAAPSLALVESSEFYFGNPAFQARESAAWWPFLLACLIFYGLLPRLALAVTSVVLRRRALKDLSFETSGFQRVYQRLTRAVVTIEAQRDRDLDLVPPSAPPRRPISRAATRPLLRSPSGSHPRVDVSAPLASPVKGAAEAAPSHARAVSSGSPRPPRRSDDVAESEGLAPSDRPGVQSEAAASATEELAGVEGLEAGAEGRDLAPRPAAIDQPELTPARVTGEPDPAPRAFEEPVAALQTGLALWPCAALCWEDGWLDEVEAEGRLATLMGWRMDDFVVAGDGDIDEDEEAIARTTASLVEGGFMLVLVESWVVPSRDFLGFLDDLRTSVGELRSVVIGLVRSPKGHWVEPTEGELGCWERKMQELGDPYLRVESIAEAG